MAFAYVAMLVWFASALLWPRRRNAAPEPSAPLEPANVVRVGALCVALAASMAIGIGWMFHQATVAPFVAAYGSIPIVIAADFGPRDPASSNAQLVVSLLQTLALYALFRTLRQRRVTRAVAGVVGVTAVVMIAIAIAAPVFETSDVYAYVGYALQPLRAYASGLTFAGQYAVIGRLLHPMPTCVYGPLWIAASHVAIAPFGTLLTQLRALRVLELVAYVGCLVAMKRLRAPFAVLAVFAVNPGLIDVWIVDGHNDLFGTALVLAAMVVRTNRIARIALVTAAGLVKLPLVVVGAVAFSNDPSRRTRIVDAAAAAMLCFGVTYACVGGEWFRHVAGLGTRTRPFVETALCALCVLVALGALGAALVTRRRSAGLTWIWPAFAAYPAAWYAIWGLPYALVSGGAAIFLVAAPIVTFLFSWNDVLTPVSAVLAPAIVISPLALALVKRTRERKLAAAPLAPRRQVPIT